MAKKGELIVALDVDTFEKARELVDTLSPSVDIFKVGSQLFTACGPAAVRFILARGKKVFLDLKYHDIPNTVANAVSSAVGLSAAVSATQELSFGKGQEGLFMLTVHTLGGKAMLEAAVKAARSKAKELSVFPPFLVGITVLTSEEKSDNIHEIVLQRARLAKESGLNGVVASVEEADALRREFGEDFIVVTPGIRPSGAANGDQKRVATPRDAVKAGSRFLVVGRPIVEAENPLKSAQDILGEIQKSLS